MNRNIKYKPRETYKPKTFTYKGQKYRYDDYETLVYQYEHFRPIYNKALKEYGRGRQRYQLLPAGEKTYSYLEKQLKMMVGRLKTGKFEASITSFRDAFLQALNWRVEGNGAFESDEVMGLVAIIDKMHHTQLQAFYNSLSPAERSILFDISIYYDADTNNAQRYAGRTIEKLVEFAKGNKKLQAILEEVAEDYAIMI